MQSSLCARTPRSVRPNASLQLLPEAGAEWTLEAVSCKAMLGVLSSLVHLRLASDQFNRSDSVPGNILDHVFNLCRCFLPHQNVKTEGRGTVCYS
jgi:hypothetical protein